MAGPDAGGVMGDDLREPERGLQPVGDGAAVAHHARDGLGRAEAEQDERPEGEGAVVVVDDAVLKRAPDCERHQCLRHHPGDAEENAYDERADLEPRNPQQQPRGGARVGDAGIGNRKPDHGVLLRTGREEICSMRRRGTRPRPLIVARASSAWTSAGAGVTRYKGPVSVAPPALLPDGTLFRPLVAHADERGVFTELYRLEWETGVNPIQWNAVSLGGRRAPRRPRPRPSPGLPDASVRASRRRPARPTARVPDRGTERPRRAERRRARLARDSVRRCARLLLPRALAARLRRHRVLEPRRRAGLPLGRSGAGAQLAGPVSSGFGPGSRRASLSGRCWPS